MAEWISEGGYGWMGVRIGLNKFLQLIKSSLNKNESTDFWNVAPRSLVGLYRCFRRTYCRCLQVLEFNRASSLAFLKDVSL
jgi:hypothetical protein